MTEEELEAELLGANVESDDVTQPTEPEPASQEEASEEGTEADEVEGAETDSASSIETDSDGGTEGRSDGEPVEESGEEVEGEPEVLPPERVSGGLMSPDDVDRMARIQDWAEGFSARMGNGISVNCDGLVTIDPKTDAEVLKKALTYSSDIDLSGERMGFLMKISQAKLIIQLAVAEGKDRPVVMSEMNVCESFGRSPETVSQWLKVIDEVPEKCFKYGLSMAHYISAATVRKPKDKVDLADFEDLKVEILEKASEDPKAYSSRQVRRDLLAFVEAVEPSKSAPKASASALYATLSNRYRLRDAATLDSELLDKRGISMGDLSDSIEELVNDLIDRGDMEADVDKITFKLPSDPDESDEKEAIDV